MNNVNPHGNPRPGLRPVPPGQHASSPSLLDLAPGETVLQGALPEHLFGDQRPEFLPQGSPVGEAKNQSEIKRIEYPRGGAFVTGKDKDGHDTVTNTGMTQATITIHMKDGKQQQHVIPSNGVIVFMSGFVNLPS